MTLERARELLRVQAEMTSGYNRNAARMILADVMREHGQRAVDQFIREFGLEDKFGLKPGTRFSF